MVAGNYSGNVSILNFGHSDTVQPTLAALGLYYDGRDLLVRFSILCYSDNVDILRFVALRFSYRAGGTQTLVL